MDLVRNEMNSLGIERNELGDSAINYLYCTETICPECGFKVPVSSSWLIGVGSKTIAYLTENENHFDINIKMNASAAEMKAASVGTVTSQGLKCPHCGLPKPMHQV